GELELDELELPDLLAPQRPLTRVVDAQPAALLDDPQRHDRHARPLGRETRPRRLATVTAAALLRRAEQSGAAQADIVEEQLAGGGTVQSHLGERSALGQPLHALVQHKGENLAIALVLSRRATARAAL